MEPCKSYLGGNYVKVTAIKSLENWTCRSVEDYLGRLLELMAHPQTRSQKANNSLGTLLLGKWRPLDCGGRFCESSLAFQSLTLIFTLVHLEVYVRVRRSSYIYWRRVNEGGAWVTRFCAAVLTLRSHLLHPKGTIHFHAYKALTKPSRSRMSLISSVGKWVNTMGSSWAWEGNTVDDKPADITQCASPKTVTIGAQAESCLSCFTSTFCPFPNMHIFITWVSQTHYSVFPPSGLCIFFLSFFL